MGSITELSTITSKRLYDLFEMFQNNRLYLRPTFQDGKRSFQRLPWWNKARKSYLIHSLREGTPIPPIYAYEDAKGNLCVVDGQQRLAALFEYFQDQFKVTQKGILNPDEEVREDILDQFFSELDEEVQQMIDGYEVRIEMLNKPRGWNTSRKGAFEKMILSVFHRHNLTASNMKPVEIWNSTYSGDIIDMAFDLQAGEGFVSPGGTDTSVDTKKLAKDYYLARQKVVTSTDILRMQDIDLILQLLFAIHTRDRESVVVHKTSGYEEFLKENQQMTEGDYQYMENRFKQVMNYIRKLFPGDELSQTLFRKKTDFYSLFCMVDFNLGEDGVDLLDVDGTPLHVEHVSRYLKQFCEAVESYGKHVAKKSGNWEELRPLLAGEKVAKQVEDYFYFRNRDWSFRESREYRMGILYDVACRKARVHKLVA